MVTEETIVVDSLTKYGPRVGGRNYYLGKKSGLEPNDFIAGQSYKVNVYTSDSGAKYINNIKNNTVDVKTSSVSQDVPASSNGTLVNEEVTKATVNKPALSQSEKDVRILVQGLTQAAMSAPALAGLPYTNMNELVTNAKEFARQMIEFVKEQK